MKIKALYISILFLYVSISGYTQNVYHLTIDDLFDKGIENSVSIQAAIVKNQISADKTGLAKNKQLPTINVGGLYGYVGKSTILDKDFDFVSHPHSPRWKQNYQVSLSQPLFQGGQIQGNIEKAKLEQEIAELSLQKNKSDLKLWLVNKYLNLFSLYKQREVYIQNIEEAKTRHHDIEQMKAQGMITNNDVLRSKLLITNYELAYKTVSNNIRIVSQQLTIVLGLDESFLIEPDSLFLKSDLKLENESDYVLKAYSQYPDMRIAQTNIDLAKTNLKVTKGDLWPTLSLQASNTLARPIPNSSPIQDLYVNGWGVTLNLSYRISAWFDKKHNIGTAKRQIHLQELMREQQEQNIRTSVRSAYISHQEALDKIAAMQESLIQATENYRIVKNKYFNHLAILTDLLDANSVLLDAELQMINARTNAIYTYYELQQVSGNL